MTRTSSDKIVVGVSDNTGGQEAGSIALKLAQLVQKGGLGYDDIWDMYNLFIYVTNVDKCYIV